MLAALDEQVRQAGSGTSGADEGISPLAPEAYEADPEGPTTSTED